jgi:disulfide bond formation protein DsbB
MLRPSRRLVFGLLAITSIGLLATGLTLGEVLRIAPCYLCNFQRFLYIVLALLSACACITNRWPRFWGILAALTALWGVATAAQQSWMQYAPDQVTECGMSDPTLVETIVNWLSFKWPAMFMVTGFCTAKDWSFLGLTLANWSALCFLTLTGVAFWQVFRRR